jgi:site-specific DNA-methyltransferase (adenine-specific)
MSEPTNTSSGYMPKSKSDKWITPPEIYNPLNEEFKFNFDPCPITWKEGDPDGLTINWKESNFVNPPYSDVGKWIKKASEEHKKGCKIVMLINVITDTIAFHEYIYNKPNIEIRFVRGRIKFINPLEPTKLMPNVKGSMIIIFK